MRRLPTLGLIGGLLLAGPALAQGAGPTTGNKAPATAGPTTGTKAAVAGGPAVGARAGTGTAGARASSLTNDAAKREADARQKRWDERMRRATGSMCRGC